MARNSKCKSANGSTILKLTPTSTRQAEKEHAKGEAAFLRFLRSDAPLTRNDREFIANVHQYLYWRAFESKRKSSPSPPPRYRSPGNKADPRLAALLDAIAVIGWPDKLPPGQQRRDFLSKKLGCEWKKLRQRIDRLDDKRRAYAKRSLALQGKTKQAL